MRIQHNILAMNAYRNYTNNTSALSKNLERLSSGYKINRAGDDAAGLAISEKMRAQITGLDAAQKNVKDGISLVKTAEGAMQEVQDMLNRMAYLATQSANGTYDAETDRANLQKEVDALKTEINRIADSANFNGIKLLNGDLEGTLAQSAYTETLTASTVNGIDRILSADIKDGEQPWAVAGEKNVYDVYSQSSAKAEFEIDLNKLSVSFKADAKAIGSMVKASKSATLGAASLGFKLTIKIGDDLEIELSASNIGTAVTVKIGSDGTVTASLNAAKLASAVLNKLASKTSGASKAIVELNGVAWKVTAGSSGKLKFEQVTAPTEQDQCRANFNVKISYDGGKDSSKGEVSLTGNLNFGTEAAKPGAVDGAGHGAATTFAMKEKDIVDGTKIWIGNTSVTLAVGAKSKNNTGGNDVVDLTDMDPNKIDLKIALSKICAAFNLQGASYSGSNVKGSPATANFQVAVSDDGISILRTDDIESADDVMFQNRSQLAGVFKIETASGKLDHEAVDASGGLVLQIGDTSDNFNQMRVIVGDMHTTTMGIADINISTQQTAQNAVSVIRDAINYVSGVRGDLGAVQNRLEHTQNNLSVMAENIQDAESTIRDTDVAEEMMSYVKNNILIQSAQAMLAQANQVPQGVLQLLG